MSARCASASAATGEAPAASFLWNCSVEARPTRRSLSGVADRRNFDPEQLGDPLLVQPEGLGLVEHLDPHRNFFFQHWRY